MSDPDRLPPKMAQRLERYYASTPRPGFEHKLEQRLLEAAKTMQPTHTQRPAHHIGRIFRTSLSLAGLAALFIVMILAFQARPKPASRPTPTVAGVAPLLTPTLADRATATSLPVVAAPRRLLPGLCPAAGPTSTFPAGAASEPPPPMEQNVQAELGGGEVTTGDFTFNLGLVCDASFRYDSPDPARVSEFEQIGVTTSWRYHGPGVQGDTFIYGGLQPFVELTGSLGPGLDEYSSNDILQGLQFPTTVFMDFPTGDLTFSYVSKLHTPDDRWAGAELRFTLHPEVGGYRPVNITVRALDPAGLNADATPPADGYTLLPTLAPAQVDPTLGRLDDLLLSWQEKTLSGAGWLYYLVQVENGHGGDFLMNGAELPAIRRDENWYLLDEDGYVQRSITRLLDEQGNPLQVSVMSEGQYRNLTLGDSGPTGSPWKPDLGFGFYSDAARAVRQGVVISQTVTTVNAVQAALFTLDYGGRRVSLALDTTSGQPLMYEAWSSPGPVQPLALEQRVWVLAVERVDAPPPDRLALFEATPQPFQPASPVGTPAPAGFDPSQSFIGMKMVVGDKLEQPSFWFGDLYALSSSPGEDGIVNSGEEGSQGGYLLGRVDFGAVPGGWCDRSADGSRIAFNWVQPGAATDRVTRLRWFELIAPGMVYEPDPELNLNSSVAFAPNEYMLAFFSCKGDACGLYLLEAKGDRAAARLLTPGLLNAGPPTWKPDGTQIASEGLDDQGNIVLTIIDVRTGAILYQGPRAGSPFESWGANIVEGQSSFERCVSP